MTHVTNVQMTLDCADPHAQARFWAEALGWVVERHTAMIRSCSTRASPGRTR